MEHMMLLVTYRMLPGQRDAFLQEVTAAGILAKVQQEDGFERYDYYLSAADPDELLIVEEWNSEAQQQAHVNTDTWPSSAPSRRSMLLPPRCSALPKPTEHERIEKHPQPAGCGCFFRRRERNAQPLTPPSATPRTMNLDSSR